MAVAAALVLSVLPPVRGDSWPEFPPNTQCDGSICSEQVHVTLGGPGEMRIVFATQNDTTPSRVDYGLLGAPMSQSATGTATTYSQIIAFAQSLTNPSMGKARATEAQILSLLNTTRWASRAPFSPYGPSNSLQAPTSVPYDRFGKYNNPAEFYNSPAIHTVSLRGLASGRAYEYRVAGDSRIHSFRMPPDAGTTYPFRVGMTADLGQTKASLATVATLRRALEEAAAWSGPAPVMLLSGDLAYADGYMSLWDRFGRALEPLASRFPVLTVAGNHEVGMGEAFVSYNARYPMPYRQSSSTSNLWWSRDVGPVHFIGLCSYAATDVLSFQRRWLERDLAALDRDVTPWVIGMWHAPWYNSNSGHRAEAELMRLDMERLLNTYGVDIVVSGHVHAYERFKPVFDGCAQECGTVYINLGNGGNREGAYLPWLDPRPLYSAFRQSSFGPALLTVHNATHAFYNWTRVACYDPTAPDAILLDRDECVSVSRSSGSPDDGENATSPHDQAWIVRPLSRVSCGATPQSCPQPHVPVMTTKPTPAPTPVCMPASDTVSSGSYSTASLAGFALGSLFAGLTIGCFAGYWLRGCRRDVRDKSVVMGLYPSEEDDEGVGSGGEERELKDGLSNAEVSI